MKIAIALISFLLTSTAVLGQDYLKKIAKSSCKCTENIEDGISLEMYEIEFGLCVIEASMPYERQLSRDHNISFTEIEEDGAKLGELIALEMFVVCPEVLMKMIENVGVENLVDDMQEEREDAAETNNESMVQNVRGEVTSVEGELIVAITVADENGKNTKTFWLSYIESNENLESNYKNLVGKQVELTYRMEDIFDPRLNEYTSRKIITKLTVL